MFYSSFSSSFELKGYQKIHLKVWSMPDCSFEKKPTTPLMLKTLKYGIELSTHFGGLFLGLWLEL
jgi:hypothetical protein